MDGGVGRAHYGDADLGEGESAHCWEVTLKAICAADKSAVWLFLYCVASAGEYTQNTLLGLYIWTPLAAEQLSINS